MKKTNKLLIIFLILLISVTGCSKKTEESDAEYSADYAQSIEAPAMEAMEAPQPLEFSINEESDTFLDTMPLLADEKRKITYSGSAFVETETFDETLLGLDQWIQTFDGMIASSSIEDYGSFDKPRRYASYTIRIPAENFQQAIQVLQDQVQVRRLQLDSQDVTDHYYDLTARIESAQTHETRLLALVEKSTELKDVLALEQELNRIRYEIENNQGILRRLESQVQFSTLYLDIQETKVVLPEPVSFWDRVKNQTVRAGQQVVDGTQAMILWLILWIPTLLIFAVFLFILIKFFRKLQPIWKKKKDPLESDPK